MTIDRPPVPATPAGRLVDRTAVVAPVDNVLGRACAHRLAAEGAMVVLVDADEDVTTQVAESIRATGGATRRHTADAADLSSLEAVQDSCAATGLNVDILVTCHFALQWKSIEASTMSDWQDVLTENVLGPLACVKAFLPALRQSSAGSIVHIGSIDGLLGNASAPSYSTAKGALIPLTHVMAAEFGASGIRVNCVARAAVKDQSVEVPDGMVRQALDRTPLRRSALPDEIARVVAFLASDDASYLTGSVIPVDGGRSGLTPGTL